MEPTEENQNQEDEKKGREDFSDGKIEEKGFKRSVIKQFTLGLLVNFSSIAPSMSLGFSAIALPALTNLSQEQLSWFASIASVATPFGSIFSGPITDRFGRKTAMVCINVIGLIGWLVLSAAYFVSGHQYPILLVGRLFTGLSTGLSSAPANIYMAEISSPNLRGIFCTWSSISFSLGILVVYFLGYIFEDNWGTVCLISAALPIIATVFIVFLVPETPSWLIRKNRIEEAKTNMCKIFGADSYIPEVQQEIDILTSKRGIKGTTQTPIIDQIKKKIKYLVKPNCLKPFSIMAIFFFFQQFGGTYVVIFYAISIVEEAGVRMDAYLAIVIIGVVRLFSAVLVSYVSKIFGRKTLSIFSGAGMTLCMCVLGGYILALKQEVITKSTQDTILFLPLVLLLLYFFTSTMGFQSMPFALAAEVFPDRIRGTASGLASAIGYIFNFIIVKVYPNMISGIESQGVFFFFGGMSLIGTIWIAFCLPETKGKSLQEIEEYFVKKPRKTSEC